MKIHISVVVFTLIAIVAAMSSTAQADEFVMPLDGFLNLQQMGGSAGAVTTFGIGTSPTNFVPFYQGLPNNPSPTGPLPAGFFPAGTTIHFGMFTTFGSDSGWAFSNWTDQASLVSFSDLSNSLGLGGSIIQQTGSNTWLLHLDDALSYKYDDDNNDVLMQLQIGGSSPPPSPIPEPSSMILVASGLLSLGVYRQKNFSS